MGKEIGRRRAQGVSYYIFIPDFIIQVKIHVSFKAMNSNTKVINLFMFFWPIILCSTETVIPVQIKYIYIYSKLLRNSFFFSYRIS